MRPNVFFLILLCVLTYSGLSAKAFKDVLKNALEETAVEEESRMDSVDFLMIR